MTHKTHRYKRKHHHKSKSSKTRKSSKHKRGKEHFKPLKCSPKNKDKVLGYTCYTSESLHKLKMIWNARHPDVLIKSNEPKEIWDQLRRNMSTSCNSEACWLRHQCIKHDIDKNLWDDTFAPNAPKTWKKKPHEWLSSVEIDQVMQQYEKIYKCFEFIGPSPINYDKHLLFGECVWEELCKFSLIDMKKRGKNKIGIIFNLDPHYKEGSHWVALFINLKKKGIYYLDSYGDKPPRKIQKFTTMVKKQATKLNETYTLEYVKRRHQYSESECGMYSLYFIIQLLKDKPMSYFQNQRIKDAHMQQLRKTYFNN